MKEVVKSINKTLLKNLKICIEACTPGVTVKCLYQFVDNRVFSVNSSTERFAHFTAHLIEHGYTHVLVFFLLFWRLLYDPMKAVQYVFASRK